MKHLLTFTASLIITLAVLLLFTAWSFAWADLALVFIFMIGVVIGWWARGAWERDKKTARIQHRKT